MRRSHDPLEVVCKAVVVMHGGDSLRLFSLLFSSWLCGCYGLVMTTYSMVSVGLVFAWVIVWCVRCAPRWFVGDCGGVALSGGCNGVDNLGLGFGVGTLCRRELLKSEVLGILVVFVEGGFFWRTPRLFGFISVVASSYFEF